MSTESKLSNDYNKIEKAISFIEENFRSQPDLEQIAASVHLSKYHFDRLFKRWAGVSPLQFLKFLTLDYTKQRLANSASVLDSALDAGLSGPGRLHDLFVSFDAMTPGDFKRQGDGLKISYGFYNTPFGPCILAKTERGICHLGFIEEEEQVDSLTYIRDLWPGAVLTKKSRDIQSIARQIFSPGPANSNKPFTLHLKGTNFQVKVWQALLKIQEGRVVSYQDVAKHLGCPSASRAVAGAIASNPVGYLIPCHRVIAKTGQIYKYRWGSTRKKALIGWEAAKCV